MSTDNKNYNKYKVKKGDSLYKIAKEKNIPFSDILKANAHLKNPSLIMPDEEINLPGNYSILETQIPNEENYERDKSVNYLYKQDTPSNDPSDRYYSTIDSVNGYRYGIPIKGNHAKRLSEEELAKFNQLAGTNIISRDVADEHGGTYAYYDDNGVIQTIGGPVVNPSTSIPAEANVWSKNRLYNMSSLADAYGYNLENLKPENRKQIEDLSKQLGYSPKEAYFELNRYLANSGQNIPEKWRRDLGISDSRINNLKSLSKNKNSSAYLYNFNPAYHETSDIIEHDLPVNLVRGIRAGAAFYTRGLSEMPLQWGAGALDLLSAYANRKEAASVTKGLANVINETDPAANWIVDPIARAFNSSNLGTAVSAGTSAALTGKGLYGKLISGIGTGISTGVGEYLKDRGYTDTGNAIMDIGSSLSSLIGSKGSSLLGAGSAYGSRQALDLASRAGLNAAEMYGVRKLTEAFADAAGMEDARKASLEGLTVGATGMLANKIPGVKRVQNYIDTVSPFSDTVNTIFTGSGGRPDMSSAINGVFNNGHYAPIKLIPTEAKWFDEHSYAKMGAEGLNAVYNNLYQRGRSLIQPSASNNDYIPNTYNGVTLNSSFRRTGSSDYSVPENFKYTDYYGNEVRVPNRRDVRHQARALRMADANETLSFDTSAPLWTLVSGKINLKRGQSVQYSNAKVSSTSLQEGDVFYDATGKGKNDVVLVEPTSVLDSSVSTKIMNEGNPIMATNSRKMADNLAKQGYTRYDEITMGNQNVDRQKSIGESDGKKVDMNLKGCTTKVSVFSKSNSSNRAEDVIVITDSDIASPGSAREHYTKGNNERDISRIRESLGISNKKNYQDEYIKQDKYTPEEAKQVLQEVYNDLNKRYKGVLESVEPVEVIANPQGEVSVTKMRSYISQYLDAIVGDITNAKSKSKDSRVKLNTFARNKAISLSHKVVTDLGSTSFTREEVMAKLGDSENPAKGTLRRELRDLEKSKDSYDIETELSNETRKKLAAEGYKVFDDNGNILKGNITLTRKHAEEVGVSPEYNQIYDADSKKLKALIAFGEGADLRQALKK